MISDLTSKLRSRSESIKQDTQVQTGHPSLKPDFLTTVKIRRDSLEPLVPDGPDTPPWTKQFPDMPPQKKHHQTTHPSSNWTGTASDQTSNADWTF